MSEPTKQTARDFTRRMLLTTGANDFTLHFQQSESGGFHVMHCRRWQSATPVLPVEPSQWAITLPDGSQIVFMHFAPDDVLSAEDGDVFEEFVARMFEGEND